jgi:hypothetical protein
VSTTTTSPKGDERPPSVAEIRKVIERAQKGDEATLPELRRMLQVPEVVRQFGGELAEKVVVSFASAMAGAKNLAFREALLRKLELMRAELLGDNPTPVERLLVERVVACWVQVQEAELRFARGQGDLTIRQSDFLQRRMDSTHRRYLAALKALALVRKLAVPALQINLARKQVNVVTSAATGTTG